jgi:hypothetical protein
MSSIFRDILIPDNPGGMIIHGVISAVVLLLVACMIVVLVNVTVTPALPGWFQTYDANQAQRRSLDTYLSSIGKTPDNVMITDLQVATANYGGIFTESKQPMIPEMTPWHGRVSGDAVRLQVEAGARAIIFDIWPNPADFTQPIVASMIDQDVTGTTLAWWKGAGLTENVSRYSNWRRLTRNVEPAAPLIKTAVTTAFNGGPQSHDPFFLILNLHGRLPPSYLDSFGLALIDAIQGKQLSSGNMVSATKTAAQNLCSVPFSSIKDKVFVIVNPDVPEGMTREAFNAVFYASKLAEATNLLTTTERPTVFKLTELSTIKSAKNPDCTGSMAVPATLPQISLCCIQPSIGERFTDNDSQFKKTSFSDCMGTGAQFVGVNLFGGDSTGTDKLLQNWLDKSQFGLYSFKTRT